MKPVLTQEPRRFEGSPVPDEGLKEEAFICHTQHRWSCYHAQPWLIGLMRTMINLCALYWHQDNAGWGLISGTISRIFPKVQHGVLTCCQRIMFHQWPKTIRVIYLLSCMMKGWAAVWKSKQAIFRHVSGLKSSFFPSKTDHIFGRLTATVKISPFQKYFACHASCIISS